MPAVRKTAVRVKAFAKKRQSRRATPAPAEITLERARALWIDAQRLNGAEPFGTGPGAVAKAVGHLGYVQIDTINVIERCHHHILYNRIPAYRRADLEAAQASDKSVFEYWTHALAYVATADFRFFAGEMQRQRKDPTHWYADVGAKEVRKVVRRVRDEGALTIADIKDDVLVDKGHPWASRKPSKRALQAAFYRGELVIARRKGMLKTYELTERHFGWDKLPTPASAADITRYRLERALRSQAIVSLDSICTGEAKAKPAVKALIERDVRAKRLVPIAFAEGAAPHWARPEVLETEVPPPSLTHILSPFDPLIIQRKRTALFFGYEHLFEAYVPRARRKLGYFTLPVLSGDEIVAALDLKADRQARELLVQAWHWVGPGSARRHKRLVEEALDRFERFQLPHDEPADPDSQQAA
jgi:uncharacterized protein YcaQ